MVDFTNLAHEFGQLGANASNGLVVQAPPAPVHRANAEPVAISLKIAQAGSDGHDHRQFNQIGRGALH